MSEASGEKGNNTLLQCDKNDPPIMSQLLLHFSTLTRLLKAISVVASNIDEVA